jgi:hypothetical protein
MDLESFLASQGIAVTQWSNDLGNKTLADLQLELDLGECQLERCGDGWVRSVQVVGVWVYVRLGEKLFTIMEDQQVFFTGAVRRRELKQLTEKMHRGEDPKAAARRLLREELGLDYLGEMVDRGQESRVLESKSYPGLNSRYAIFNYQVLLTAADLIQVRFAEVQSQKISLFTLEPVLCEPH